MPQPALTVFLIIAAIAIVAVLIAVIVIALRAQRRRKLAQTLEKRRDDEVQYAFIVNPSKPQAEARRLHIQRFCEAKGLNRIRFYDTQLDKDGRVCALEALEDGADVVIAVGGDGTVRTVASALSGTGHALGIMTTAGVEVLIHVGVDTVEMKGDGFSPKVKEGDKVKKGDLLLEMDLDKIAAAAHPAVVITVVTNTDDFKDVEVVASGAVEPGADLIKISK